MGGALCDIAFILLLRDARAGKGYAGCNNQRVLVPSFQLTWAVRIMFWKDVWARDVVDTIVRRYR